ncbi:ATP-binding cassette domain-containing protein [Segnochrobactrum spirostomi]|uniref:Sugar ABC transporter ATP-binding protein n=1 Tax=Segnochrobactrum spirostomi TaxID=2608987 RepID=A0A6A7Y075_9HYPH|nr:ATP-binding cassette domain-containing protein [Segnochrobactrum spirostomi]MQT11787.1 sugar ABC transporter ATP-binding protein [Segnochrobactrum spirostomi]
MLAIEGLSKRYGETIALSGASIDFGAGLVHSILGENGSGKSTLVKLLSGIVLPDAGAILFEGHAFSGRRPADFQAAGFMTVFQEVLIAPDRTVIDNVLMGYDGLFRRRIARAARRTAVAQALARFARTAVPLDALAGDLPLAAQQLVVLARAVVRRPKVLVLDEVTAALDFADREAVFALMRDLADAGTLILFITHRMDEVTLLSDRISILRGGKVVATRPAAGADPDDLLRLMAPETAAELAHHG